MNRIIVAVFLFMITLQAFCQESDTIYNTIQPQDTLLSIQNSDSIYRIGEEDLPRYDTLVVEAREPKSPTKALMFALVLPGMGQAYNGKYWKIPIVWGALGVAGYAIYFNTGEYENALYNYILEENSDNERIVRGWKRNMELSYIAAILIYGLQILDAYVDANMYTWDVNDNLSLRVSPSLKPLMTHTSLKGLSGGLTCSIKIRGR
jgi:hypothetical protein